MGQAPSSGRGLILGARISRRRADKVHSRGHARPRSGSAPPRGPRQPGRRSQPPSGKARNTGQNDGGGELVVLLLGQSASTAPSPDEQTQFNGSVTHRQRSSHRPIASVPKASTAEQPWCRHKLAARPYFCAFRGSQLRPSHSVRLRRPRSPQPSSDLFERVDVAGADRDRSTVSTAHIACKHSAHRMRH